jgi:hypothetical protein
MTPEPAETSLLSHRNHEPAGLPLGERLKGAVSRHFGRVVATSLGVVGLVCACGPSAQSIYEGDIRFEHCYRLDLDLNIAPTHRDACWKQWVRSYTYGQSRDKIEYARRRIRAFSSGDISRPTLNVSSEPPKETRAFYLVVPEPTSVHAPPPPMATPVYTAPVASTPPPPVVPDPPRSKCATSCETSWQSCEAACGVDGGMSATACKSCEPDYKRCMKRCFD